MVARLIRIEIRRIVRPLHRVCEGIDLDPGSSCRTHCECSVSRAEAQCLARQTKDERAYRVVCLDLAGFVPHLPRSARSRDQDVIEDQGQQTEDIKNRKGRGERRTRLSTPESKYGAQQEKLGRIASPRSAIVPIDSLPRNVWGVQSKIVKEGSRRSRYLQRLPIRYLPDGSIYQARPLTGI